MAKRTGNAAFRFNPADKYTAAEGVDLFYRILGRPRSRVLVSVRDFEERRRQAGAHAALLLGNAAPAPKAGTEAAAPAAPPAAGSATAPAAAGLESMLEEIWKSVLGHSQVSRYVSFFECGGHSLLAVGLMREIANRTGAQLPLAVLYEAPTIRDLARRLADETGLEASEPEAPGESAAAVTGGSGPAALEGELAQLFGSVLGVAPYGPEDSFFEQGGHSLLGVQLIREIQERWGVALPLSVLLQAPTPRRLAVELASAGGKPSPPAHAPPTASVPARATVPQSASLRAADPSADAVATENKTAETGAALAGGLPANGNDAGEPAPALNGTGRRVKPLKEGFFSGMKNRILQVLALYAPGMGTLRVWLHRWRGVEIGRNVAIGTGAHIETAFPQLVSIGDDVQLGQHTIIIGHFRDTTEEAKRERRATVRIEEGAFIGPGVILMPNVTIGRGAVVTAGSVVNQSVEPQTVVQGNPAVPVAKCDEPLAHNEFANFARNLKLVSHGQN